jgi:hypothetical protein
MFSMQLTEVKNHVTNNGCILTASTINCKSKINASILNVSRLRGNQGLYILVTLEV